MHSALLGTMLVLAIAGSDAKPPPSIDWRDVPGIVNPVRDQGKDCNAGWAFATAASLEASMKLVFNMTTEVLSPQLLLDCDIYGRGCLGGTPLKALTLEGIESEADYPYTGKLGKCHSDISKAAMDYPKTIEIYYTNLERGERGLQDLLLLGPLAALVDARSDSFKNYKSGVYYNPDCSQKKKDLNHAVLVVGYGTDPKEGAYWLVKNSWGTEWGEQGYMRIARNKGNPCGLITEAALLWDSRLD